MFTSMLHNDLLPAQALIIQRHVFYIVQHFSLLLLLLLLIMF